LYDVLWTSYKATAVAARADGRTPGKRAIFERITGYVKVR